MARILVLDDSRFMRNLVAHFLEQAGHEAVPCEESSLSGIQGFLQTHGPDLVLTGYQMPGCNGLTVARLAHAHRADLPVVLLTATRDPAIEEALLKHQPLCILHKPVQEGELLATVTRMLG